MLIVGGGWLLRVASRILAISAIVASIGAALRVSIEIIQSTSESSSNSVNLKRYERESTRVIRLSARAYRVEKGIAYSLAAARRDWRRLFENH